VLSSDRTRTISPRGANGSAVSSLLTISLPKGTPIEAEVAVRRLIELSATLAQRVAQLQQALDSRIVIEQAKGVLVERYDVSPAEAFELMRTTARFDRVKLQTLAAEVVASRATPPSFKRAAEHGRIRLRSVAVPPAAR